MKKAIKTMLAGLLIVPMLALGANMGISLIQPDYAQAQTAVPSISEGASAAKGTGQADTLMGDGGIFTTISNVALYVIGAISVLMLIYGGIRYTISGGDSSAVTAAKNTILYAIVGIVIALLAYAVVNFVLKSLVAA